MSVYTDKNVNHKLLLSAKENYLVIVFCSFYIKISSIFIIDVCCESKSNLLLRACVRATQADVMIAEKFDNAKYSISYKPRS